jgi:hypothetical protein
MPRLPYPSKNATSEHNENAEQGQAEQSVKRPDEKGRRFDVLTMDLADWWSRKTYYFDVTELYGSEAKSFPVPK